MSHPTDGINPTAAVIERDSRIRRLTLPIIVSPSEVELGIRCHRREVLHDILRVHSFKSPSASFGTQLHRGSHTWWDLTAVQGKDHVASARDAIDSALDPWEVPDGSYHTKDLARAMLTHYVTNAKLFAELPGAWELVSLESRAMIPVDIEHEGDTNFLLSYQRDRLLRSVDDPSVVAIVDLKSAAKFGSYWDDNMRDSIQQKLYNLATRAELEGDDHDVSAVHTVVEGIQKKDGIEMRYVWPSLHWTPGMLDEALSLAQYVAQLNEVAVLLILQSWMDTHDESPDLTDEDTIDALFQHALNVAATATSFNYMDCRSYYMECPYYSVCRSDPDARLGLLLDGFTHVGQRFL